MNSLWYFLFAFEGCVVATGLLCWKDSLFTHRQMFSRFGTKRGLPFLGHGGMWGDFFIVSPIISAVVYFYGSRWQRLPIIIASVIGIIISMAAHNLYTGSAAKEDAPPDCLVHAEGVRPAGVIHVGYFAAVFSILVLFFFCTPGVNSTDALVVAIAFAIHMALGVLQPPHHVGKKITTPDVLGMAIGVWVLLAFATIRIYVMHH